MISPVIKVRSLIFLGSLAVFSGFTYFCFPEGQQFHKYTQAASQALAQTLPPERIADLSPAYFYLHWIQQRFFPTFPNLILYGQLLASAAGATLLMVLLQGAVPRWVAGLGVAAFVFNRSVVSYAAIFEPEAFLLCSLLAFVVCMQRTTLRDRALAGLFLAICLAFRPNFLPFLLLAPVFIWLQGGRGRLKSIALFCCFPLLVLAGLSIRNARQIDTVSPIVMNPGYVFYEGNNPLSSGQSAVYPPVIGELRTEPPYIYDNAHLNYRLVARGISGENLSIAAVNRFWAGKAFNYIHDYPTIFLKRVAEKVGYLFHSFLRYDLQVAYLFDRNLIGTHVPFMPFAPLAVLAVYGLWACRRDWRKWLLPLLLIGVQSLAMLCLYVSDRQRLAVLPFVIVFACLGIDRLRRCEGWKRYGVALTIAGLGIWLSFPSEAMQDNLELWKNYADSDNNWMSAVAHRDRMEWGEAKQCAVAALAAAPWLSDYSRPAFVPSLRGAQGFYREGLELRRRIGSGSSSDRLDTAMLMIGAGDFSSAEGLLANLARDGAVFDRSYLQSSQPEYFLGWAAYLLGRREEAMAFAETAYRRIPGDPFVLALLAALSGDSSYEQRIESYFSKVDAAFLTGLVFFRMGNYPQAIKRFEYVARMLPDFRRARIYLVAAYGQIGEVERAADLYDRLMEQRIEPVLLEDEILSVYRKLAMDSPEDPEQSYRYGRVLAQYGHLDEALVWQKKVLERMDNPEVRRLVMWLQAAATSAESGN